MNDSIKLHYSEAYLLDLFHNGGNTEWKKVKQGEWSSTVDSSLGEFGKLKVIYQDCHGDFYLMLVFRIMFPASYIYPPRWIYDASTFLVYLTDIPEEIENSNLL
jgi:hypothetical protein